MQLVQLLLLHGVGRAGQGIGGVLHLGEGDHVPDAARAADEHGQPIEAVCEAPVGRRAVLEGVEQEAEALLGRPVALQTPAERWLLAARRWCAAPWARKKSA